jgi:hypothetical protein
MLELNWHDSLVLVSFVGSIAGLVLLSDRKSKPEDDRTLSQEMSIKMSFIGWIVYCISVAGLKLHLPEDSWLSLIFKLSTVISYLLTVSSILSLPLQRINVRQVED